MAVSKRTATNSEDGFIIRCEPHRELACGYTKIKVMPDNYSKILLIASMTGKTIQDVANELLEFAISKTSVQSGETTINLSELGGIHR